MIVGVDFCCISVATKGCEAACPGRWQNLLELFAEEKPVPNQCWNLPNLKVDTMGWNWNGQLCLQLLCSSLKPQLMSWGGGRKQPPKNLIPKVDSQLSVPLSSFQMNMEISIDCTISIYNGQTKIFFLLLLCSYYCIISFTNAVLLTYVCYLLPWCLVHCAGSGLGADFPPWALWVHWKAQTWGRGSGETFGSNGKHMKSASSILKVCWTSVLEHAAPPGEAFSQSLVLTALNSCFLLQFFLS